MKKIILGSLFFFLLIVGKSFAQESQIVPAKEAEQKNSYFGLGAGLPYGWFGINFDTHIYKRLFLSLGAGLILDSQHEWDFVAPAINLGPSIRLGSEGNVYQPAITFLYGVNSLYITESYYGGINQSVYRGTTLGLCNNFLFGKNRNNGFSIDFLFVLSSKMYREYKLDPTPEERFKLGLAYKHKFRYK